jgi:hypothetical protein
MSGFVAVAGTLLIIDYSPTANTYRKKGYGIAEEMRAIGEFRWYCTVHAPDPKHLLGSLI